MDEPRGRDGVLGLSHHGKSSVSLLSQLTRRNVIEDVFGHCIAFQSDSGDVAAGFLFFGLPKSETLLHGIQWAHHGFQLGIDVMYILTPP